MGDACDNCPSVQNNRQVCLNQTLGEGLIRAAPGLERGKGVSAGVSLFGGRGGCRERTTQENFENVDCEIIHLQCIYDILASSQSGGCNSVNHPSVSTPANSNNNNNNNNNNNKNNLYLLRHTLHFTTGLARRYSMLILAGQKINSIIYYIFIYYIM